MDVLRDSLTRIQAIGGTRRHEYAKEDGAQAGRSRGAGPADTKEERSARIHGFHNRDRRQRRNAVSRSSRPDTVLSLHVSGAMDFGHADCEIQVAAGFTFADHCAFRPRMPTGSARPTRRRDIALPRSRFASMRAAASA